MDPPGVVGSVAYRWAGARVANARVRKNPFVGVRTYWTLTSDENWARTHRFAGYAFVGAALISFCGTAASGVRSVLVAGVAMGLAGVASAVFSYVIARRTPQR